MKSKVNYTLIDDFEEIDFEKADSDKSSSDRFQLELIFNQLMELRKEQIINILFDIVKKNQKRT